MKNTHLLFGTPSCCTREGTGRQDGCREGEAELIFLFAWKPEIVVGISQGNKSNLIDVWVSVSVE